MPVLATDLPLPDVPLDRPLPVALTGSGHGWFARYRTWPVFSPGWVRGRLLRWGLVLLVLLSVLSFSLAAYRGDAAFPITGILGLALGMGAPLILGPLLGAAVRRQRWPAAREWTALVAVIVGTTVVVAGFEQLLADSVKQKVSEWTGETAPGVARPRVRLAIGITLATEPAASAPSPGGLQPPDTAPALEAEDRVPWTIKAVNFVANGLIAFWLAGGMALPAYRREREGLRSLAREQALAQAQARRREAELKLSVLAAQVEPHFLFNTLAGVRSAIATDPARASEMIDRLVDYLRAAIPRLRSDGAAHATLAGQLDIVRAYLGLMAARMPRLRWQVDAPADLLDAACPPLMLISLAENAVKHGIEPKMGPARITITAQRTEDGRLQVSVADDGVGFGAATAGTGLGLANIRERLAELHGDRAGLTLRAREGGGVVATLSMPLDFPPDPPPAPAAPPP